MVGELNFNLLEQGLPAKVMGSFAEGRNVSRENELAQARLQQAQSQNELSKYTLNAAKRSDEQQNQLNAMMQNGFNPDNPEHTKQLYGMGPPGMAMVKSIQEGQVRGADLKSKGVKTDKDIQDFLAQGKRDMMDNPSDANVTAWTEDAVRKGYMTPELAEKSLAHMMQMSPAERAAHLGRQGATASDISSAQTSANTLAETGRHNLVTEATGQGNLAVAQTNARTSQGNAATSRMNADTSRGNLGVAQEGLKLRQAGTTELPPKEVQKREAKYPAATAAVRESTSANDRLVQDLERLKTHPGLKGITGVVYGRTPSVAEASREAKAVFDKIMARGGFQELAKMRAASPTGGALGNVSDTEGKYLRAAFAAMDPTQSEASFKKAIDDAITELKGSNERVRDAYEMTYDYRKPAAAPTAQPASGWGKATAQ